MANGYGLTKDELNAAGQELMDTADNGKLGGGDTGGASALSGTTTGAKQDGDLDGFAISGALGTVETQWEDAIDTMLAKVSLTGDKIMLAAENYGEQEYHAEEAFAFLEEGD
ncbi:hypothetical protein EV191_10318 [Tamaricihabitans halophyticus]|uniref:Excreted virulence factor EspC (Type VII ESX diderm) n=1 Tax=Tamaricihabitans halophyticus TaxID=1262583 RepID=A0A4R2QY99_9PSEU|nr:hypothetical protein [Tamaricihabitans halophyticus]TCP53978.1 hypothetical protein EV191_10318 [Tamaricihabitans halophyticus]